jgi:hypothetical protein
VLVHLSRVNNVPEIAEMTCREALTARGRSDVKVVVTRQDRVTPTVDLGTWTMQTLGGTEMAQGGLPFAEALGHRPAETQR